MIYRPFKDDIQLSTLGMGNMRLPTRNFKTRIDYNKAKSIIDYAMQNGINYYDTAAVYHLGQSESFLGRALKEYPRESYHLATKYFMLASKNYEKVFEKQLKKLGTDYIDFYLIHSVVDATADRYINSGAIEFFKEQQKKGRIKYLGFSSHASVPTLERFADHTDWDFAQIQLNYYDWFYSSARKEYEALTSRNIPIMVMEPVRGGKLAKLNQEAESILHEAHPDWSTASWAMRFVNSLPGIQTILSGMSTLDQIKDNVDTFASGINLTEEDLRVLSQASESYHGEMQIPCTSCRYCTENCPRAIEIPDYLNLYNNYLIGDHTALEELKKVSSKGKPADCINCKQCTSHCPQNINIPERMSELQSIM